MSKKTLPIVALAFVLMILLVGPAAAQDAPKPSGVCVTRDGQLVISYPLAYQGEDAVSEFHVVTDLTAFTADSTKGWTDLKLNGLVQVDEDFAVGITATDSGGSIIKWVDLNDPTLTFHGWQSETWISNFAVDRQAGMIMPIITKGADTGLQVLRIADGSKLLSESPAANLDVVGIFHMPIAPEGIVVYTIGKDLLMKQITLDGIVTSTATITSNEFNPSVVNFSYDPTDGGLILYAFFSGNLNQIDALDALRGGESFTTFLEHQPFHPSKKNSSTCGY